MKGLWRGLFASRDFSSLPLCRGQVVNTYGTTIDAPTGRHLGRLRSETLGKLTKCPFRHVSFPRRCLDQLQSRARPKCPLVAKLLRDKGSNYSNLVPTCSVRRLLWFGRKDCVPATPRRSCKGWSTRQPSALAHNVRQRPVLLTQNEASHRGRAGPLDDGPCRR